MQPQGVYEKLKSAGIEGVLEFNDGPKDPAIVVDPPKLPIVLQFLKEDGELAFDTLSLVSGVPYDDRFECVYHLLSTTLKHAVVLRVRLDKEDPAVPTASFVYPTADWHERETFDLVGVRFEGHPDPRRIYLPEGWEGHPLRRDYVNPTEFQGIPLTDVARTQREAAKKASAAPAAAPGETQPEGKKSE